MELGGKIKQMRNQKGLTQEELADRCELTKGYISQLENDLNSPSIATLTDILSALGSNLSEFFREEAKEKVIFGKEEYFEMADSQRAEKYDGTRSRGAGGRRFHLGRYPARGRGIRLRAGGKNRRRIGQ